MAQSWNEVLEMVKADDTGKWDLKKPGRELQMDPEFGHILYQLENGVCFAGNKRLEMTDHAFGQFCGRMGAPARYLKTLPTAYQAKLFNYHLTAHQEDEFLLRCKNDTMRAFLSGKYSIVNNSEVVNIVAEIGRDFDHSIKQFYFDDKGIWAKILVNGLTRPDPGNPHGDLKVGLLVGNSEVGCRAISIEPFVYRKACTNDLVVTVEDSLKARHIWLTSAELKRRAVEAVGKALETGADLLGRFAARYEDKVENPSEVIKRLCKKHGLSQEQSDATVLAHAAEPYDNAFGVINAFTRAAQKLGTNDRVDIERLAGKLLSDGSIPTC